MIARNVLMLLIFFQTLYKVNFLKLFYYKMVFDFILHLKFDLLV